MAKRALTPKLRLFPGRDSLRPLTKCRALQRCYACDRVATGYRDRRPEGGYVEPACDRRSEMAALIK